MPSIPEREFNESLTDLLESIALEEVSLAHYVNAEAEKIQAVVKLMEKENFCLNKIIEFQESVTRAMRIPIKKELLLQFKLEDILDFKREHHKKKSPEEDFNLK